MATRHEETPREKGTEMYANGYEDVWAEERKAYPRERYEADRAKLIAEGVEPRLIMSYAATLSSMAWEAEREREAEIWESYDEAMAEYERQMDEDIAEYEAEQEIAREVAERDALIELVELADETAMSELAAFGNVWPEDGVSQAEYDETLEEFWEFACDLYEVGETWNERLVLTELY